MWKPGYAGEDFSPSFSLSSLFISSSSFNLESSLVLCCTLFSSSLFSVPSKFLKIFPLFFFYIILFPYLFISFPINIFLYVCFPLQLFQFLLLFIPFLRKRLVELLQKVEYRQDAARSKGKYNIVSLYKREDEEKVTNYRGISL